MDAPAISTLQDDESPSPPAYGTSSPATAPRKPLTVKLRIPPPATLSNKPSEEAESDEDMIDELQDDDELAAAPPVASAPPPAPPKTASTRGGKGSRGPRKKRPAQIGERVMSPLSKPPGSEWVVQVADPAQVAPMPVEESSWDPLPRGRGRRGAAKRAVPGPGRGWRRGLKGKNPTWQEGDMGGDSTPNAFLPQVLPPVPPTTQAVFREYRPPSSEIIPPSLPQPMAGPSHIHLQKMSVPPGPSPPRMSVQQRLPPQYPPPIVQPSLPQMFMPQPAPHHMGEGSGSGSVPPEMGRALHQPTHGVPSRPFPVQAAPKPAGGLVTAPPQPLDRSKKHVRKWTNVRREIKGIGGSRWLVRQWIGEKDSDYAIHRAMMAPPPNTAYPPRFRFKQEFHGSTGTGTPDFAGTPREGSMNEPILVDLTGDADMDSPPPELLPSLPA